MDIPDHNLFFDGAVILGKAFGDQLSADTAILADAHFTIQVYKKGKFSTEAGAGVTFFTEFPSESIPGDLQNFLGFTLLGRVRYAMTEKVNTLLGVNFSLPSSAGSSSSTLVTTPVEAFLSVGWPRGESGFFEARLEYLSFSTSGTVAGGGGFDRHETFIGPEFLISKRL